MHNKKRIIGVLFCITVLAIASVAFAATKQIINVGSGTSPLSSAVIAGDLIFVSGQIPVDANGKIPDGIEAQTKLAFENLKAVIEASGGSMSNVVKTTVYITNFDDFAAMNKVYATFFTKDFPARSTAGVSRLALGVLIEIDAIVVK